MLEDHGVRALTMAIYELPRARLARGSLRATREGQFDSRAQRWHGPRPPLPLWGATILRANDGQA